MSAYFSRAATASLPASGAVWAATPGEEFSRSSQVAEGDASIHLLGEGGASEKHKQDQGKRGSDCSHRGIPRFRGSSLDVRIPLELAAVGLQRSEAGAGSETGYGESRVSFSIPSGHLLFHGSDLFCHPLLSGRHSRLFYGHY